MEPAAFISSLSCLDNKKIRERLDLFCSELGLTHSLVSAACLLLTEDDPIRFRERHNQNLDLLVVARRMTETNVNEFMDFLSNPPTVQEPDESKSFNK